MTVLARDAALSAAQTLLTPLAGFLLKCGITWREFSALAKTAFVAAATGNYGIQGRPTNISRVALLTGLSRKEVKRQRELLQHALPSAPPEKTTDATRVLSGWHQDSEFLQSDNSPRLLTREEFADLCERYCADVRSTTLLKELVRVGAIVETDDSRLNVVSRYYMPSQADSEWMMAAGGYLADITRTINYNFERDSAAATRFLGRASDVAIARESVDEFHEFLESTGQEFLESVDNWLAQHRVDGSSRSPDDTVRLGVGVFHIQNEPAAEPEKQQAI